MNKGNNKITEQSYKGKVKTHKYINRQNQSTTGKLRVREKGGKKEMENKEIFIENINM
jgi:hypothetical protein